MDISFIRYDTNVFDTNEKSIEKKFFSIMASKKIQTSLIGTIILVIICLTKIFSKSEMSKVISLVELSKLVYSGVF